MEFSLPKPLVSLGASARALAESWVMERPARDNGSQIGHDPDFALELGRRGWIGMSWPVEDGGGGRTPLERFVVFEQLLMAGAPVAAFWIADRQIGPTLIQFGTPSQRARWLPSIRSGQSMWCIGMSEPDHGSDVANLRTRARRDGGSWRVDGRKVWTSGAAVADWMYLVARTDPDARPHEGLSEFVLDMRSPGVQVRPIVDMTGNDHFCEVLLDGVQVPEANRVGHLHGSFRQLMRQMDHERGGIDRLVSNRLLLEDVRRSGILAASPVLRDRFARLETEYRIGRLMVLRESLGQAPVGYTAAAKTFCTEHEQHVASFVHEAMGAHATAWSEPGGLAERVARNVCYAPAYTIMGGTTQILRNIIAERTLGLPR